MGCLDFTRRRKNGLFYTVFYVHFIGLCDGYWIWTDPTLRQKTVLLEEEEVQEQEQEQA